MTQTPAVRDLLEQIQGHGAWAVIRRKVRVKGHAEAVLEAVRAL